MNSLYNANQLRRAIGFSLVLILLILSFYSPAKPVYALEDCSEAKLRALGVAVVNCTGEIKCETHSTTTTSKPLATGSSVYILGDSITYLSTTQIETAFSGGGASYTISKINADSGRAISTDVGSSISTGLDAVAADSSIIANSKTVVVALGTNSRYEGLDVQIPILLSKIRDTGFFGKIYWVNVFSKDGSGPDAMNTAINSQSNNNNNYTVIDTINAGIELSDDNIHPTEAGKTTFANTLLNGLKDLPAGETGAGQGNNLGFDPLTLRYPLFPDETGIIQKLKAYIADDFPNSPFAANPQYVDQIFQTSKQTDRDINPLLVIAIAKQENGFGQANSNATENKNYFGITNGPKTYREFGSVEEGIDYFVEKVSRHVSNPTGAYTGLTNFYEYLSVHQVGLIAYPDQYPDDAPGKDANPPYLTYDERMDIYTSWDVTRNSHRPSWDPVKNPLLYNPGVYYRNSVNLINKLTGLNLSTDPQVGANLGGGGTCGGGTITTPTGDASKYIKDCNDNNGNAAIACTAINQLMGLPYPADTDQRAAPTELSPAFLDCSALTGMAIYRTFGVNLNGLCSVGYLSNSNFESIDVNEIKTGDIVGKGTICGTDSSGIFGHVAIVVSYDPATKKLITVETGSTEYLSGLRGAGVPNSYNVGLEDDSNGNYTWAVRYIGDKTLQSGAL